DTGLSLRTTLTDHLLSHPNSMLGVWGTSAHGCLLNARTHRLHSSHVAVQALRVHGECEIVQFDLLFPARATRSSALQSKTRGPRRPHNTRDKIGAIKKS